MTPGDIDALVAEKVMGWEARWVRVRDDGSFLGGHYADYVQCHIACQEEYSPGLVWVRGDSIVKWKEGWHPSTDIVAAWTVVEQMRENNSNFVFGTSMLGGPVWFAEFGDCGSRPTQLRLRDKSAPMAICLAALKAVGVEVTP